MALKFDSIKSLFIVDDEEEKVAEKKAEQKGTSKKTAETENKETKKSQITWESKSSNIADNNLNQVNKAVGGEFNQQIFESLTKAIANANLPGEDYIEFIQALKAMKDIPLEESVKIQSVLATLSTRGLTVAKVIESADYYLNILKNEKQKFYTALEGQAKGGISNKKKQIADLDKANKQKADKIAALTQEIKQNQENASQIKLEISNSEAKLKSTENSFVVTYNKVANKITENVNKIKLITK